MAGNCEYDHRFMKIHFGSKLRIWIIDKNITRVEIGILYSACKLI